MDHREATETLAAERYLLNEFTAEEREAFEEHFFTCDDCALDVRASAAMFEHGRAIFAEEEQLSREPLPSPVPQRAKREWLAWLRPPYAVPLLALLLLIIGLQNAVEFPARERALTAALETPAVLPSLFLHSGSARGNERQLTIAPGQAFVLLVDIPAEGSAAYIAELYDSAHQKRWSLAIPADASQESLALRIPSGNDPPGTYTLTVRDSGASGHAPTEISSYVFKLNRP